MGRNAIIMRYTKARNIIGMVTPDMFHVFGIISTDANIKPLFTLISNFAGQNKKSKKYNYVIFTSYHLFETIMFDWEKTYDL